MAYELEIRDTNDKVKIRSPWAAALLPIITLGVYHLVWWYRINRELRDYGRAKGYDLGQNPTNSVLAIFPGAIIIVPTLMTYWRRTKRVQGASKLAGQEPVSGWICLILYLLIAPGFWAYLQISLNELWRAEADLLPGQPALPAAPDALPPRLAVELVASFVPHLEHGVDLGQLYLQLGGDLSVQRGVARAKRSDQQCSIELDEAAPLLGDPTFGSTVRRERPNRAVRLPADRARDLHGRAQPLAQRLWIGV